ncbi:MAG TPA: carboxypeptidase-like regulatory domain-containing protein, partial [Chitinophagaceae bacterium]|nr:carboxypeptidase-like regulatory domain-containing protein [Chitinophagaceae bacterium]
MNLRLRLAFVVLLLSSSFSVFAQIKLTGKILNTKNEPIAGVSVKIIGAAGGAISDIEGRYSLNLTPGKKYELEFSATGYSAKRVNEIEVGTNSDNELNIVLEFEVKVIEGVVVKTTSRRQESTNSLLTFQRSNTALSSGLAADFIRRTPDKNTGEVLKRVSGASIQDNKFVIVRGLSDRYNSAIINNAQLPSTEPDKKAFSFDVIPAALIDNIIINKTATPELPGDFAGGLVQINTRDIPAKDMLSIGVSIGFNTQSVFKDFTSNVRNGNDWMGFDDGTRGLPDGFPSKPQIYRAGTEQQMIDWTKLFNSNVYNETSSTAMPTQTYNITFGKNKTFKNGGKLGTIISLQYRNSMLKYDVERKLHQVDGQATVRFFDDQNKYSVNVGALANITYVKGRHKISFKNLFNQLFEDNYYIRNGSSTDRVQDINFRSSVLNQRSLYSGQLEGNHQLTNSGIKLMWN